MKLKITYGIFFLLLAANSLIAQKKVVRLAIEAFYVEDKVKSTEYVAEEFRDVSPFDPNDFYTRGIEKYEAEFYSEALLDFNESIALYPECSPCFYFRGLNYIQLDSVTQAKRDLSRAIDLDPLLIEGYNILSKLYSFQNQPDSARYILELGIEYYPAYASSYYNLGLLDMNINRFSRASRRFKTALELDSCNIEVSKALIAAQLYQGNTAKPLKILAVVEQCNPNDAEVYIWKALVKLMRGDPNEAIEYIDQAIMLNDTAYFWYGLRGYIKYDAKQYKQALADFAKAYELNNIESKDYQASWSYRNQQIEYQNVLTHYKEHIDNYDSKTKIKIEETLCHLIIENISDASNILDFRLSKLPEDAFIQLLLGIGEQEKYNYKEAESHYSTALEIDPKMLEAYRRRGLVRQNLKDFKGAIFDFSKLYSLNPRTYRALKYRGMARYWGGDFQKALIDFNIYYQGDTTDIDVLNKIGFCQTELGLYDPAIQTYKKYLSKKPSNTDAIFEIARIYYFKGDTIAALANCDTLLQKDSCYALALNMKGTIAMNTENFDLALIHFNEMIKCSPYYVDGYYNRSILNFRLEEYQNALFDVQQAIIRDPGFAEAYYLQSQIKHKIEDKSACRDLKKAVELGLTVSAIEMARLCPE